MPPQALLSFPGVSQVLSWSFTLSHGISPSVAQVEIAPQFGVPAEIGTMLVTFGDIELAFPGCVLDSATVRRDPASGMIVHLSIVDRRWAWRYGQISGRYNVRRRDGALDPDTEQAPQDLAALLLGAMGESNFDVSGLPNDPRPEVDWVYANPAEELASLAESLGCRVVLDLDSRVLLVPQGAGLDLPETGLERTQNFGIDPPDRPGSILLVGGPSRFQTRFRLEAVGQETTGEIVPLDELSFTPASGWESEAWLGFPNVTGDDARAKARQTVFRWYRIKCTAPADSAGEFQIAGYDGDVAGLWQLLPLEAGLIDTYEDSDGIERPQPPEIEGTFWDHALDAQNVPQQRPWRGRFELDRTRGIVRFAEPLMQIGPEGDSFSEAELYLTIAHGVKDAGTLQEVRHTFERTLAGEPTGAGPRVIRRDDLMQTTVTEYDGANNPVDTRDNAQELEDEASAALDAAEAGFETLETDFVEYAGIIPIGPDGAIQQVEWTGGPTGALTRASRNSEFSLVVPSDPERRRAERARGAVRLSAAEASAAREARVARGSR